MICITEYKNMKLKQWADKQGIKYLTAYRWFRAGTLPVPAYQTESGTIIVEDDANNAPETAMQDDKEKNTVVSQILKKTVEFSKSNASVEDFAAYMISNFKIEQHPQPEAPKPRGPKPTPEMAQNHFKQFIKAPLKKPEANMFLLEQDALDHIVAASNGTSSTEEAYAKEISSIFDPTGNTKVGTVVPSAAFAKTAASTAIDSLTGSMNNAIANTRLNSNVKTYTSVEGGAVFTRSYNPTAEPGTTISVNAVILPNNGLVSGAVYGDTDLSVYASEEARDMSFYDLNTPVRLSREAQELKVELELDKELYTPVTYDEARKLVDLLVAKNYLPNDTLVIDRQAKEVCKWSREVYDTMLNSQLAKKGL